MSILHAQFAFFKKNIMNIPTIEICRKENKIIRRILANIICTKEFIVNEHFAITTSRRKEIY
jgi:hypothetical protein